MTDPQTDRSAEDSTVVDASPADGPRRVRHREHQTPGRPYRLSVRLSATEHQALLAAAEVSRLTPTGYAGRAIAAAALGQATPTGDLVETLRELQREMFAARRAVNMLGSNINQGAAAYNSTGELPNWFADALALCRAAVLRLDGVTGRVDRRLR